MKQLFIILFLLPFLSYSQNTCKLNIPDTVSKSPFIYSKLEYCPNPQAIQVHTKFNIQDNDSLKIIVEHIEGVEPIETWMVHKYSFLVLIGEMYDREEIGLIIQHKVEDFAKPRSKELQNETDTPGHHTADSSYRFIQLQ